MIKYFSFIIVVLTSSADLLAMQQDPLDTIKKRKSFFIVPYVQADTYKIPSIGIYGDPYILQDVLARIKLDPKMVVNAPAELRQLIPEKVPDLSLNILLHATSPQTYNMVFHDWAGTWQQKKLFNINVPMGVFAANGVQPANSSSIPFNQLMPQQVYVHNGGPTIAYSPPNARFAVSPQRDISSFWSIALSQDKQHGIVTFHILANTQATQDMIATALKSAHTLKDFLNALRIGIDTLPRPIDQQTLQEAAQTIETTIGSNKGIVPAGPIAPPQETLENTLETLTRQLQRLYGRLTT